MALEKKMALEFLKQPVFFFHKQTAEFYQLTDYRSSLFTLERIASFAI